MPIDTNLIEAGDTITVRFVVRQVVQEPGWIFFGDGRQTASGGQCKDYSCIIAKDAELVGRIPKPPPPPKVGDLVIWGDMQMKPWILLALSDGKALLEQPDPDAGPDLIARRIEELHDFRVWRP